MDMQDRISQALRCIAFIATAYDQTDAVLLAALGGLKSQIESDIAGLPASRAAAAASHAAYLKRIADNQKAVIATDGKLPEPMNASIGLKV